MSDALPGIFESVVNDVMQQSAELRAKHQQPLRVRIGERQWLHMRADPMAPHIQELPDDQVKIAGLPVRVDREWDVPVVVETREDQKP